MASLENFLINYSAPLAWLLGTVIFLGFSKAVFSVLKAIWKYFRRGIYDF